MNRLPRSRSVDLTSLPLRLTDRRRSRIRRPLIEGLEDRVLLSVDTWINSGGGDWDTGSNWSNGVPGPNDIAEINLSSDRDHYSQFGPERLRAQPDNELLNRPED